MQCPKCRTELTHEANFCYRCGQVLNSLSSASSPINIADAERKRVTALFSDISGYTAMNEKLDPEEVKGITTRI